MQIRRSEMAKGRVGRPGQRGAAGAVGLRRVAIAVAGFGVLTFGVALLVVPVPGTSVVVVPIGLAILAREFQWAQRLLDWSTAAIRRAWTGVRRLFGGRPTLPTPLVPLRG